MKKTITIFALAVGLIACQPEGRIYNEHQDLSPELEWLKKDSREFIVPIEDNSQNYNMSVSFRYTTGYQYQTLEFKITETSPSGKVQSKDYSINIIDEKGEYIGEPGLDIWDMEALIEPNRKFEETGNYTFVIEHLMPNDPVNFAMEVGLILDKAK